MDAATASGTVEASVQPLVVIKYRSDSDAPRTYRMALVGQVVSVEKGIGGENGTYKVQWLCRSERPLLRDVFSTADRYRRSRASDYGDADNESILRSSL